MFRIAFLLSFVSSLAGFQAQTASADELVAQIHGDLDGDGYSEIARLERVDNSSDASLVIFSGKTGQLETRTNAIFWVGGEGQQPELKITSRGSLQVISMNESIGRNRWHQTATIALRGGYYLLAGYTYSWYDTLDLASAGECDVNLLNGKGLLHTSPGQKPRSFRTKMRSFPIQEWDGEPPQECLAAFE